MCVIFWLDLAPKCQRLLGNEICTYYGGRLRAVYRAGRAMALPKFELKILSSPSTITASFKPVEVYLLGKVT